MIISRKVELNLLVTAILLFVFRMAVPFMIYIFIPYFLLLTVYYIVKYWKLRKDIINLDTLSKVYSPFLIISGILVFSFILSDIHPFLVLKDILHTIVILWLIVFLFLEIDNISFFEQIKYYFSFQIIAFSSIISVLGLIKFVLFLKGVAPPFLNDISPYNSSLTTDYNFYILAVIIGYIFTWSFLLHEKASSKMNILLQVLLFLISINILLSSSRRGFVILLVFLMFSIAYNIYRWVKLKVHCVNFRIYLLLITTFSTLLFLFVISNNLQKQNILKVLKLNNSSVNKTISVLAIKYSTIFHLKYNDADIEKLIYGRLDPLYPCTGWGSRIHLEAFPLKGNNVEILPANAVGYKMNSACNATFWDNNSYSYTNISRLFQGDKDQSNFGCFSASVYCYVSDDFDGTWARICVEGNSQGNSRKEYDLSRKGVWQKLKIEFRSYNGIPPVYLYWSKYGVADFRSLKGYIIFAYPEYKIVKIDPKDPDTGWGSRIYDRVNSIKGKNCEIVPTNTIGYKMDSNCNATTWNNNAYSYTNISGLFQGDTSKINSKSFCASIYCYVSEDFNGTWSRISSEGNSQGNTLKEYDLSKKGVWQKLQIEFTSSNSIPPVYLYWSKFGVTNFKTLKGYVIFAYPEYKEINKPHASIESNRQTIKFNKRVNKALIYSISITDLFEELKQQFKSNEVLSDTTSIYNDNFKAKIENEITEERTERWRYSWYLFKHKYTWKQKIVGNGFNYLEVFGKKFGGQYDWPHNPIISTFLYSGILGGFVFIWFLVLVIVNYLLYLKQHLYFFISFIITSFFVFFSDYSLFNTPIFTFLCIIPFFTKYLYLKEEYKGIQKIPLKRLLFW